MKRRTLGLAIVLGLVVGPVIPIASRAGADSCPDFVAGHWTGSGFSNTLMVSFSIDATVAIDPDGTTHGSYKVNGGSPISFVGSIVCTTSSFQATDNSATFGGGTLSVDGRSMTGGTYTTPGDHGTWTLTADPYVLDATSSVQPTSVTATGVASWVVDVKNTGGGAATRVAVLVDIVGDGAYDSTPCSIDEEEPSSARCELGTILPGGTASVTMSIVPTAGAGTSMELDANAVSANGGGTNDVADPVTVSVVSAANLPPGEVSGIAQPGVPFSTPGKATPTNPIVVKLKLPKKVAAGTTSALGRRRARHHHDGGSGLLALVDGVTGVVRGLAGGREEALRPAVFLVRAPSVPMSISRSSTEASTFCGGAACSGDVIHFTSFSGYNDPKHPAKVTITWDASVRGRGVNSSIYKRADSATSPTRTLPGCLKTAIGYVNTPCISKRKLAASGDVQFTLLLLSGDPKFARR